MIDVRDLAFAYPGGDFALRVPGLRADAGERIAILGASGSGKTTLLELIAGIRVPDEGLIEVAGQRIDDLADTARRAFRLARIGLVFQSFELLDYLTVRDNILLPFRLGADASAGEQPRARAERLATACGIGALLDRRPDELSQGERQRVAICRALVTSPGLILADEPTGNLDPGIKHRVLDLLIERAAANEATLVMVTHDADLLAPFERRIDMRELGA